ncbi:MAG: ribonuclease D [Pseudoxanthomonas sp.]
MPHWIDSPAQLAQRLQSLPAWVGLDTEFIRERTYWPQLALVQIAIDDGAGEQDVLLVDPLPPGMTDALKPLLTAPGTTKVMHSASEDIVALHHACGVTPAPLFDTQIAAALAGVGAGLGYQKLVQEIAGVALDKGETRSDWLRRPLSAAQLQYAADDVLHLGALYSALQGRLAALGREDWLRADCARLVANADDAGERWPHLSMRSAQFLDADAQRILLRLLRWRDAQARSSDRPRNWILDNELAATLARTPPADFAALTAWLDRTPKSPRKLAEPLWRALTTPLPDEAGIPLARNGNNDDKAALKRLQDAVAQRSRELGLPDGVLASRRWLEVLLDRGEWPPALQGWRREQLGSLLAPLLASPSASG